MGNNVESRFERYTKFTLASQLARRIASGTPEPGWVINTNVTSECNRLIAEAMARLLATPTIAGANNTAGCITQVMP
jgi:hypothetical protein